MRPEKAIEILKALVVLHQDNESCRNAISTAIEALGFKLYFEDLYEKGLEVANWHLNGELEAFETFYDEAMARGYREEENND